jgi:hypothetical protein
MKTTKGKKAEEKRRQPKVERMDKVYGLWYDPTSYPIFNG